MTKQEFFGQPNKCFFIDDLEKITAYVKETQKKELEEIIKVADDVCNQRFVFTLRWDMERTCVPEIFEGEIDWLRQPGDDPEFIYQMVRHRYWICLGQAYAATGDEKYADTFVRQLQSFVRNVPLSDPKCAPAWRTIEAGLRLEYWLKAVCYFEKSPALTDEVMDLFFRSVTEHCEFLMGIHDTFRLVSNWGVLQNHGLLVAGVMLPETERTIEYRETALKRLHEEIMTQVYDDGVHWEQSPMYHNEVVLCYLDVKILAHKNGIQLPKEMDDRIHKLCMGTFYHKKPDHMELCMGDSDDIDVRDILAKGAYLYSNPVLKFGSYHTLDFDSVWDLGYGAIAPYLALKAQKPVQTAIELKESGNYYLHTDWSEEENYLHFFCGTLGAGHGHSDTLHIDLFANGEDILVDSGRFTYVDKPERYEFKDPSAHNTVTVDGLKTINWTDPWGADKLSRALNRQMVASDQYDYLEGGTLGYYDNVSGTVFVNRRIVFIKPGIYVVADEFYGTGAHTYRQYFHFAEYGTLKKAGENHFSYESGKNRVDILTIVENGTQEILDTRLSRHYNEAAPNKTLCTTMEKEGFASIFTVISVNQPDSYQPLTVKKVPVHSNFKEIIFEDKLIEALTLTRGVEKYTAVIAHQDYCAPTDSFTADGCTGFGHVVIYDRAAGEHRIGKVLVW